MLSNVTKMWCKSDVIKHLQRKNLLPVAYVFNFLIFMGNAFLWKLKYRSFQSCLRVMKGKLTSYLNAWHASFIYVSCVYLPLERCLLKYVWCGCCYLSIFVTKKLLKALKFNFLCAQGILQGGRVEDHRMVLTRHLHLPQSYIQAILYTCKTD